MDDVLSKPRRTRRPAKLIEPAEVYAQPLPTKDATRKRAKRAQKKLDEMDAAAWEVACNEVTAAILSDQVHQFMEVRVDAAMVLDSIRKRVAEAKVELGEHKPDDVCCTCRHGALITVGANQQSRVHGANPSVYYDGVRVLLDRYLTRRN